MTEALTLVSTFGVPLSALVCLALWLRPWVEKAFQRHIDLLDATTKAVGQIGDMHEKQHTTLAQILERQDAIAKSVSQIHQDGCKWGRMTKGGDQ